MSGSVHRRHIADGAISPKKLADALKNGRYWYAHGGDLPNGIGDRNAYDATFPTANQGTYANLYFRFGSICARYGAWLNTNAWGPERRAIGENANWCPRNGSADYIEYTWCNYPDVVSGHASHEPFVQAASKGFQALAIRIKAKLATGGPAGHKFYIGFMKGDTTLGKLANHSDYSCLGHDWDTFGTGPDVPGFVLVDNLNSGTADETGVSTVDAWVENETHELLVILGKDKDPSTGLPLFNYYIDGKEVALEDKARFVFDDGDEVFPFLFCEVSGASNAYGPEVEELEVYYLDDIDDTRGA